MKKTQRTKRALPLMYLLTIRCCQVKEYITKADLDEVKTWLSNNGVIIKHCAYENLGKYRQLHLHAIASYKGRWAHLNTYGHPDYNIKTYFIRFDKIYNIDDAYTYIHKQTHDNPIRQDQILIENAAKHEYLFV